MSNLFAGAASSRELSLDFWIDTIRFVVANLSAVVTVTRITSLFLLRAVASEMGVVTAATALSARLLALGSGGDSSHAASAVVGMLGNVLRCEIAAAEAITTSVAIRGPVVAVGCGTLVGLPPSSLGSCRGVSTRKAIRSLVEVRLTSWDVVPRVNTHDAGEEIGMSVFR